MDPSRVLRTALIAAALAAAAAAQDEPPAAAEATAETISPEEAEAERLRRLAEPGEHHQHLGRLAGEWELAFRVWPTPDGEPVETAGRAEARWILGGRFLWTIYRAELFGERFEAWAIDGYDNQAEEYVGTWRDSQGTYTLIYRGRCWSQRPRDNEAEAEPAGAEEREPIEGSFRTMEASLTDPLSGESFDIRSEITILEDGSFLLESFVILSDEEKVKNLEIVGRRPAGGS